jgi:uncharacterized Zn finger protein (UPF0148 family)
MRTVTLICDDCETPLVGEDDIKDEDNITCTSCGKTVTYEVAQQQAADRVAESMAREIEDLFREGSR